MEDKVRKAREQVFINTTTSKLNSGDVRVILSELHHIRISGNILVLPNILNLLANNTNEEIIKEVVSLLGELKDPASVPVIAEYISSHKSDKNISKLIGTCWQTGLDYSNHLNIFAECFIIGNYEQSLESFTVIEEMLWRSSIENISKCLELFINSESLIIEEKKPLYNELIKILKEGATRNKDDYPDFYKD
jgi:DNA modification methylase